MNFHPLSWTHFFEPDDVVVALPSWGSPRLYLKSVSIRQRWLDSDAFYPALTPKSKALKLVLRIAVSLCPIIFSPTKCSDFVQRHLEGGHQRELPSSGLTDRLIGGTLKLVPRLKQSAIVQSLFPGFFKTENLFASAGAIGQKLEFVEDDLSGLLEGVKGGVDRCVLLVGAAWDAKQKYVARVIDAENRILAYIKFGAAPLAQQQIEKEFGVLGKLPPGIGPVPISFKNFGEGKAIVLSAVKGEMLPATLSDVSEGKSQASEIGEYLEGLKVSDELFEIDEHPAIVRLRQQVEEFGEQRTADGGQRSEDCCQSTVISFQDFEKILAPLRDRIWPIVIQHGDFTPWNILRTSDVRDQAAENSHTHAPIHLDPNTSLVAIDWEEGEIDGFPGFDFVHFFMQTGFFIERWSVPNAVGFVRPIIENHLRVDKDTALAVLALTVLDDYCLSARAEVPRENPLQQFRQAIFELSLKALQELSL